MTTTLTDNLIDMHRAAVAAAVLAPSAENVQPWQFTSDGSRLTLLLDRERMMASDVDWMLALTGLGACLENAVIAAREQGYEPEVSLTQDAFPQSIDERLVPVAALDFVEAGAADPLFPFLSERCTCRRMEGRRFVRPDQIEQLSESIESFPSVQVDWLTDWEAIGQLADLVGQGNRMRFEHQPFHDEFYHNMRFTEWDVKRTNDGLDVATLQLPFGVAPILFVLRKWPRMRLANLLGFSCGVARQAAKEVRGSDTVGILTVDAASVSEFLNGGRAFERLWLTATSLGLALHPTASLPVFLAYAQRTDCTRLLPHHAECSRQMVDQFFQVCPSLRRRTVQMVFRLGYAAPPTVRSLRRPASTSLELK